MPTRYVLCWGLLEMVGMSAIIWKNSDISVIIKLAFFIMFMTFKSELKTIIKFMILIYGR